MLYLSIQGNDDKSEVDDNNGVYVSYSHFQSQVCFSEEKDVFKVVFT